MNRETRVIEIKSPLDILHQTYPAETLMNLFHRLPIALPASIKEIEIEKFAVDFLAKYDCEPAMKKYKNFPSEISISRNHIITHGVPSSNLLNEDDVLTVDIVCKYRGWYADMSWTYGVEKMSERTKYLLNVAWKVCREGLCMMQVGNTLSDVARAIRTEASHYKAHVYNQFVGHGIGKNIHELPFVRYDKKTNPIRLRAGMVMCVEPIVSMSAQNVLELTNGTYVGTKKNPTAVYEHMVAIFENGPKVLTYGMISPQQMPKNHPQLF